MRNRTHMLLLLLALAASACEGARPSGPAGGDLSGDYPDPTVEALQNQPLTLVGASAGQVLTFSGTQWQPASLPAPSPQNPVRVVAAGVFAADGTPVGPVFGGLQLTSTTAQGSTRAYTLTFQGYQQPDEDHTYMVSAQPLLAPNATVAIGAFAEAFLNISVRQLAAQHQLAIQITEVRGG